MYAYIFVCVILNSLQKIYGRRKRSSSHSEGFAPSKKGLRRLCSFFGEEPRSFEKGARSCGAEREKLRTAMWSKKCFALGLEETHASSKQGKLRRIPPVTTLHLEDKNSK